MAGPANNPLDVGSALESAQRWTEAAQIYDRALAEDALNLDVLARRVALARRVDPEGAVAAVHRACAAAPAFARLQAFLADALLQLGRPAEAAPLFRRAIALEPVLDLFNSMAQGLMPGPHYQDNLQTIHGILKPATYLEIGVFRGRTLGLAQPPTRAFGVDPELKLERGLTAETRLFEMTSDAFFEPAHFAAALGDTRFDLAFIDGLHLFEQVLRDFINVERHATPQSTVLFHDTLPLVASASTREITGPFWCGDVWKILPCLETWRPDLRIATIPTYPSGLSIVTGLDPHSTVLADRFDAIVAELADRPFAWLEPRLDGLIAAHANDPAELARTLGRAH